MVGSKIQQKVITNMIEKHGKSHENRIRKGVQQTAQRWRKSDGDAVAFEQFCLKYFLADAADLDALFERFQQNLESLLGNLHKIDRDFNWPLHVDTGPMLAVDHLFASYELFAHFSDDMFKTGLAFAVLLNFPLVTLEEKGSDGSNWSRRKWAEVRLAEMFSDRVPGDVKQQRTTAYTAAEDYIYNYFIHMGNLIDGNANPLFPRDLKLISHWGLRDELKGQYANPEGLPRQQMIFKIMERIITQEIPEQVINSDVVKWNPFSNGIFNEQSGKAIPALPEINRRYEMLLKVFHAEQMLDPHMPHAPSLVERRFKVDREIPEAEVETALKSVLSAPVLKEIGALIRQRLGRNLQPFDLWYPGFKSGGSHREDELDRIVSQRFPNVLAFQEKLDEVLMQLGFTPEKATYLQKYIKVDPSRGAGHAMGAKMRGDAAHLRTRVPHSGMNYKGFNTAMHELGHTVEQVFSMNDVDYYTLEGVPNTAFTEAFAFVFQARDLEVLGLAGGQTVNNTQVLHEMWQTAEIAGVSLLDMRIWRWLYENPGADADALKTAVIDLAKSVWNEFFAPIYGVRDQPLLAIYSHIIYCGMYIPDYAIGHIIAFQIEDYLRKHNLATEMERMCRLGRIAPQVWMREAIGNVISAQPIIDAAEKAVEVLKK